MRSAHTCERTNGQLLGQKLERLPSGLADNRFSYPIRPLSVEFEGTPCREQCKFEYLHTHTKNPDPHGHRMTAIDFASFLDRLAAASGDTILPFFRTALAVENKKAGGFDPVTAADRAAENAMRTLIREHFPAHGIIGEEYGSERTDAEYVWLLDPIDGTKSFIAGMLAWGTLIGLMRFGEPVYGAMHQPFTREQFFGDGGAARYRGPGGPRDLRVRRC